MTRKPYFSIVMPAYGVEAYIEQAIRSIQAQTESDWEIIVVDDCAKDRSGETGKPKKTSGSGCSIWKKM